jgi:hypothetical protein
MPMPFIGLSKPPEQILSPSLHVGSRAPESPFLKPNKKNLIVFLRHTGCPFAEAALKALSEYAANHPETNCCAILHGETNISEQWATNLKLTRHVKLIFDEQREHYGKWGIGYSTPAHLLHPMMLVNLAKLALKGIRNRNASGTRWQQQAAFLVDENGTVRWYHLPRHAGDLPNFLLLQ